jgi:hypothetical protein
MAMNTAPDYVPDSLQTFSHAVPAVSVLCQTVLIYHCLHSYTPPLLLWSILSDVQ